jgi:hypothetical protein
VRTAAEHGALLRWQRTLLWTFGIALAFGVATFAAEQVRAGRKN